MRVISVNLGEPRDYEWNGRSYRTAIDKRPVTRRVAVGPVGLIGDLQANLKVHGGRDKSVYLYPSEHYEGWNRILAEIPADTGARALPLQPGSFGENLTTEGVLETELGIGDRVRVGTAVLEVSQPRMPCQNLAMFHRRESMIAVFGKQRWPGIYFRVLSEGELQVGDSMEIVSRGDPRFTVTELANAYLDSGPPELLQRALAVPGLSPAWRERFETHLRRPQA